MQPYEVVRDALRHAPDDAERLLAWFINSTPPIQRQTVHSMIANAIRDGRLTGEFDEAVVAPLLFTAVAANETWVDLEETLDAENASAELVKAFFRPDGLHFAPQAYPHRWAPAIWNVPLTPAEVRNALGMDEKDVKDLRTIVETLLQADDAVRGFPTGGLAATMAKARLRIGVLPYGDGLPMVTLLYAVSDMLEGLAFGPASFYRPDSSAPQSIAVEDGVFNVGYATAHQIGIIKKDKGLKIVDHHVWHEGFTRSLLLRVNNLDSPLPQFQQLSFVGQFGPDGTRSIDVERSDPMFSTGQRSRIQFLENFRISETIDPIVNWELPLVLSFASGLNGFAPGMSGLALTVSTDAHLWAASFGLNLGPRPADGSDLPAVKPTFRHAAWDPTHQGEVGEEDRHAQLCWFVPEVGPRSGILKDKLGNMIERLIESPLRAAMRAHEDRETFGLNDLRRTLAPLAQSLLAPLLTALPSYGGAMLAAPPEAWMTKLLGPSHYIEYRPSWFGSKLPDGDADLEAVAFLNHLKSVA